MINGETDLATWITDNNLTKLRPILVRGTYTVIRPIRRTSADGIEELRFHTRTDRPLESRSPGNLAEVLPGYFLRKRKLGPEQHRDKEIGVHKP